MQLDPDRQGELDGEPNGLVLSEVSTVKDTAVLSSNLIWGANPRVDFDRDDSIHITWFETGAKWDSDVVELRWTRIQSPVMLSLIHISEPRDVEESRMPSSA